MQAVGGRRPRRPVQSCAAAKSSGRTLFAPPPLPIGSVGRGLAPSKALYEPPYHKRLPGRGAFPVFSYFLYAALSGVAISALPYKTAKLAVGFFNQVVFVG